MNRLRNQEPDWWRDGGRGGSSRGALPVRQLWRSGAWRLQGAPPPVSELSESGRGWSARRHPSGPGPESGGGGEECGEPACRGRGRQGSGGGTPAPRPRNAAPGGPGASGRRGRVAAWMKALTSRRSWGVVRG